MKADAKTMLCFMALILSATLYANNIKVGTPTLVEPDPTNDYVYVQFSMAWENSWRDAENWDAAWVFVKYKLASSAEWQHAYLNDQSNKHQLPGGYTCSVGTTWSTGIGVFIYRDAEGEGNNLLDNVKLRWEYGLNGVPDNAQVVVQVFAVEMVYIAKGPFWVGDKDMDQTNCFHDGGTTDPFFVDTEGQILMDPSPNCLWYRVDNNYAGDQFIGYLPSTFPKGVDPFYCMKYEISQGQYADFLNTLTPAQDLNRFPNNFGAARHTIHGIQGARIADRPDRGCNWLSWADGAAYADWAGLRPMSELEFEKVCRGPLKVFDDEYAWGADNIVAATDISGPEDGTETITNTGANCCYNTITFSGGDGGFGPLRSGIFAKSGTDRKQSGAGYYGVMQLSGNVWERTVTVGDSRGRKFRKDIYGDGSLNDAGDANEKTWPDNQAHGAGYRGGCWKYDNSSCHVASRYGAAYTFAGRYDGSGFRCVRSAP